MEGYKDNSGFNAVFGSGGGGASSSQAYLSALSELTQVCSPALTQCIAQAEVTSLSQDISIAPDGTITYNLDGLYNLNFSIELSRATGGGVGSTIWFWIIQNGVAVANSTTSYNVEPTIKYNVASLDFLFNLVAGDTLKVAWTTDNDDIELIYEPAPPIPMGLPYTAIPSVIINTWKIN